MSIKTPNAMGNNMENVEEKIQKIEERNQQVEADKAWETSWTRRILLTIFTYLAIAVYMWAVDILRPWLNAVVPAVAFMLSTLTMPFFKKIWIKRNKKFQIACVRGLIDTDGSVIIHKYGVNGKLYNYKKLQFTSLSRPLLLSVYKILKDLEVNPRLARQKEVWIDSKMSVKKYFDIVGSHNLKHLNRYRN